MNYELPEGVRLVEIRDDQLDWYQRTGVPLPWRKVMIDVTIKRVADGLARTIVDETGFDVADPTQEAIDDTIYGGGRYQWQDGNYGCDCNRRLMFQRAGDEDETDHECGHGEFVITSPDWLVGSPSEVPRSPIGWYGVFRE